MKPADLNEITKFINMLNWHKVMIHLMRKGKNHVILPLSLNATDLISNLRN
jgi:hypothetical protein